MIYPFNLNNAQNFALVTYFQNVGFLMIEEIEVN